MKPPKQPGRAKTPAQQHAKQQRVLLGVLIFLSILLIGAGATAILVTKSNKQKAQLSLDKAITLQTAEQGEVPITSQLGFTVTYNTEFIEARGQVTTSAKDGYVSGVSYDGNDLQKARSYSIVKMDLKKTIADGKDTATLYTQPQLTVLTTARQEYFPSRTSKYPGLSNTEIAVREFTPQNATLQKREQETINNVLYEKLLYAVKSPTSGTILSYELQHITVQNDRPYLATLYYYPSTKEGDMQTLSQALSSLSYAPPASDAEYLTGQGPEQQPTSVVAGTSVILGAVNSTKTVNTPKTLKGNTELSVVAKNQLAVVRVGTIYCYNFSLLNTAGAVVVDQKEACTAGTGSGAIMSEDGKISTNGHVVTIGVADALAGAVQLYAGAKDYTTLQQFLDYFKASGMINDTQAQAIMTDLKALNSTGFEAMVSLFGQLPASSFKINSQSGKYAIQLSNEPIHLTFSGTTMSFKFSKSVVEAKYIDSNFDLNNKDFAESTSSDVALLDIVEDRAFPVVIIGSMDKLRVGSELTAVGFPAFVDGGIGTSRRRTIPSATQGKVFTLVADAGGHRLVGTKVPVAQGNSGGPAFDKSGKEVGLVTYSSMSASGGGKTKFGTESFVRDIADFTELAAKNNVTFTGKSKLNDKWYPAIAAFTAADYGTAHKLLKEVQKEYGDQYLVASLLESSSEQLGGFGSKRTLAIVIFGSIAVLLVAIGVCARMLLRNHNNRPVLPTYTGLPPQMPAH